jgi:galactitol-1-phosphate 5-dehydrogenase
VVGAGTIGLLAMQCALALGAKSVTAIDINDDKLALAKTLGATAYSTVKPSEPKRSPPT